MTSTTMRTSSTKKKRPQGARGPELRVQVALIDNDFEAMLYQGTFKSPEIPGQWLQIHGEGHQVLRIGVTPNAGIVVWVPVPTGYQKWSVLPDVEKLADELVESGSKDSDDSGRGSADSHPISR